MSRNRVGGWLLCLLFALCANLSIAWYGCSDLYAGQGDVILQQVDKNLFPDSYELYRKLINIEPDGSKREFIFYTVRKGRAKIASLFLAPASEKGRATLRLGDNMWLYIPNVGRPIRITSLQSVTGGIFNNADIMRLDFSVEYNCARMEEKNRKYILDLKAKTDSVAYDRLLMVVDKKTILPEEIKCFAASGMLIKTLHFKNIKEFGPGIVRPAIIETDSPLHKGYKSIMIFARLKKRNFPDEVFTFSFMSRLNSLRK